MHSSVISAFDTSDTSYLVRRRCGANLVRYLANPNQKGLYNDFPSVELNPASKSFRCRSENEQAVSVFRTPLHLP